MLNAYFSCFPNNTEHLHGFGIRIISMIFGDSNFQLSNFVYKFMYPSGPLDSGWANSGYIAEAWADFGWLGVILYPILLGLIVVKTGKIIAINKSCCPQKAMVLEVFSSFILAYLSISSALSSVILITIIILCLMIKFLFIEVRSI